MSSCPSVTRGHQPQLHDGVSTVQGSGLPVRTWDRTVLNWPTQRQEGLKSAKGMAATWLPQGTGRHCPPVGTGTPGSQRSVTVQGCSVTLPVPHAQGMSLKSGDRHSRELLENAQFPTTVAGGCGAGHGGWDYVPLLYRLLHP